MKVSLLPLYSKLHDRSDGNRCPVGTQGCQDCAAQTAFPDNENLCPLSAHQVATVAALRNPQVDVVINTALTGDGKSLAAYLPVLLHRCHAFGMYPANELIKDQARQFEGYTKRFGTSVMYEPLWGAKITELSNEQNFKRRADLLIERFKNVGVILTNPDIFTLVMNYQYKSLIYSDQELPYALTTGFDYLLFDEFHVFSMPQIVSALTAILYMKEYLPHQPRKFIFSSATTDPTLVEMIERGGLRWEPISGDYSSTNLQGHRLVLYPTELHLHQLKDQDATGWVADKLNLMIDFWKHYEKRKPKGAIIVNSVAVARRIARLVEEKLGPHGITIGENTGLTDDARRKVALEKDIVVGTSTIDVGVDFNINFLIFEFTNGGSFLQRLGRLGRNRFGEDPFDRYQAHALFPAKAPWILERFEKELEARNIADGGTIDRAITLREIAHMAFPKETDFLPYARRWGVLQAAHVIRVLRNPRFAGAYESLAEALEKRYCQLFNLKDFTSAMKRYRAVTNEPDGALILDEVLSFRGSSPFQIGLWDVTVEPNAFIPYDFFPLVQTADYRVVEPNYFYRALCRGLSDEQCEMKKQEFKYVMHGRGDQPLFIKVHEFYEDRERLILKIQEDLSYFSDRIAVLKGFSIEEPRVSQGILEANEFLKRQEVVCFATRHDVAELRRRLHLPAFFALYRLRDVNGRDYTVVFGKEALMLESLMLRYRGKREDEEPFIV